MIDESKIQNGIIVSMRYTRSFGFIMPEGGTKGDEIFFHGSAVLPTPDEFKNLHPGDRVTYEESDSNKGPRALHVTLVPKSQVQSSSSSKGVQS